MLYNMLKEINNLLQGNVVLVGSWATYLRNETADIPTEKDIDIIVVDESILSDLNTLGTLKFNEYPDVYASKRYYIRQPRPTRLLIDIFIVDEFPDYTIIDSIKVITKKAQHDYYNLVLPNITEEYMVAKFTDKKIQHA